MEDAHFPSLNALFLDLCLLFFVSGSVAASFSAELIHRDSPKSPFHDPTSTPFSRLHAANHRSASRAEYLLRTHSHTSNSPLHPLDDSGLSATLNNYNFEYVMIFYIGSKKKKIFACIDTGSDLIWVLCNPCHKCYKHKSIAFNPSSSKSYKKIHCKNHRCFLLKKRSCDKNNKCKYVHEYIDESFVGGLLSTETLGLESAAGNGIVDLKNITFGCTHRSKGSFHNKTLGYVGLDRGPFSLVNQLGHFFGSIFSYCFPYSFDASSKIYFGSAANVSGPGAVTTPLVHGFRDTSYYLILETIRVAEDEPIIVRPPRDVDAAKQSGNILIDSGTTFTYIDSETMPDLIQLVKKNSPYPAIKSMTSPSVALEHTDVSTASKVDRNDLDDYDLCFDISKDGNNPQLPEITFQFARGASVILRLMNAFIYFDENTVCLSIKSNVGNDGLSLFGSLAQMNYRIVYNLDAGELTIQPKNCSQEL